jgi:hypothetical protein
VVENLFVVSFLIAALVAAVFVISALMMRRATLKVIKTFCEYEALDSRKARHAAEMGLDPPDLLERMLRPRDYRPQALRMLNQAGIVHSTGDGRLYMAEDKLDDGVKCSRGGPEIHA